MEIKLNISPQLRAALGRTRDYVDAVGPSLAQEAINEATGGHGEDETFR